MENRISIEVPADVQKQAEIKVRELAELLKPYLIALTPSQRQALPKMGDKSIPFVEKAISYCESKPDFAPRYLNIPELQKDFNAYQSLTSVMRLLRPFASNLDDTIMLCGSEAYVSSLTYYNSVKEAARRSTTDAKPISEDLRIRFSMIGGNKNEATEN